MSTLTSVLVHTDFTTILIPYPNSSISPHETDHSIAEDTGTASGNFLDIKWWVPPSFGLASIVIGLGYPLLDGMLDSPHRYKREWSSVIRCLGLFTGLVYAGAVSREIFCVWSMFICICVLPNFFFWYEFYLFP